MLERRQYRRISRQLKCLGFKTYQEFLDSDLWKVFKNQIKKQAKYRTCQKCESKKRIDLHHTSYRTLLNPRYIIALCRDCHDSVHR